MLDEKQIINLSTTGEYEKGCKLYLSGKVNSLVCMKQSPLIYAGRVDDDKTENLVQLVFSKSGEKIGFYDCDCEKHRQGGRACCHIVALYKAVQGRLKPSAAAKKAQDNQRYATGEKFLKYLDNVPALEEINPPKNQPLTLIPVFYADNYRDAVRSWLEFRIGRDRMYVVRSVGNFLNSVRNGTPVVFGKQLTVDPAGMYFPDELSQKLWDLLWRVYRHESMSATPWVGLQSFSQRQFLLSAPLKEEFFSIMEGHELETVGLKGDVYNSSKMVRVVRGNPKLRFELSKEPNGAMLSHVSEPVIALDEAGRILYHDGCIYLCDPVFAATVSPIMYLLAEKDRGVAFHDSRLPKFFGEYMGRIAKIGEVNVPKVFQAKYNLEELTAEFYLAYPNGILEITPSFRYGDMKFNPLTEKGPKSVKGKITARNVQLEKKLLEIFKEYGFREEKGCFRLADEEKCYDFFNEGLEKLHSEAEVYYSDDFIERPVRSMPKVMAGVSVSEGNLLEVTFSAKDIDFNEILAVLNDYRLKKRFHRLADGSFINLNDQEISPLADLMDNLNVKKARQSGESIRLPLSQAMYLDELSKESGNLRLERSRSFKSMIRQIRSPDELELEPPSSLSNILREYQVTGFRWLSSLAKYHLGGILADDMGLGKTLQVLTFLLSERAEGVPPSLVVAPTSLLYNWLEESERFTPELKAVAVTGTRSERERIMAEDAPQADFLVTTYNLLRRDIDLYEARNFHYCFLDEAQHIKNPATQAAKAVKTVKADGYFALTGTPFENTLTELWSIFDFMLPGYLLSHAKFRQRYETPIVKGEDTEALDDLRRHITPFVMRRLKKDVLKELPDKVESRRLAEMTEEQTKVYKAYFAQSQKEFAEAMAEAGIAQSRIKILALLTRLRQIACDPSMFLDGYTGGSGKLDMLTEVVSDAVESGHRLLIFSQFTSMLKVIRERLTSLNIECMYLDGQTPSKDRLNLVKDFNAGKAQVFLISLKAGGTGLNLTGADMVIHYDPWWNPAVEDQATDRAYRIGQQKNVQVLKFIAKDTIEERIYKLQEKKRDLFDQMIKPGESFLSGLSDDEIKGLFAN